ncbi:hypothetical protein TPHA_0H02120 [Tetrapisispora phaffii CBS 4417]|uniref:XPA C-terminal domain-containing protein n=1 Tax=Tetrapisispora phaffii (strain ATCC 24235 / CBS 4417 / NBRC 1672 / NRRL Y-8282 / UCD 70-5) TaxID=1071381 RepID=G8BWG5_TETPH|nr:hypothetical protein TPHA_0H02120 [Tetrapisispora phaffii CBS 4417]CCE64416.1 hypothetical protein TPHA_0H02120 [Tetrapisispora phaffii CBS 4417]
MTPEQKAKIEANRIKALERLKSRGILKASQEQQISRRIAPTVIEINAGNNTTNSDLTPRPLPSVIEVNSSDVRNIDLSTSNVSSPIANNDKPQNAQKDPLSRIRPSIRTQDYIEYDFAKVRNSNGGFINIEDRASGFDADDFDYYGEDSNGPTKHKSLEDWKREQQERKYIYENAPPPEHISQAPKCIECKINIEMDPVLNDVFKLQVCKKCAKDIPEKYALLTKTECKEDYLLTDPELNDIGLFHRLEKPNPHSGTFARMQLFVRCEIEKFAFEKWEGEEGLDNEWKRREEGKVSRREKKYQEKMKQMRLKTRAQEYTNRLKEKKYGKTHVHNFSNPIDGGEDEDGNALQRRRCMECGLQTDEVVL